jgi:predicted permease
MAGRKGAGASWLDVKYGIRMLWKHPGLTVAAVFALAVGIPVSVLPTLIVDAIEAPLPEDHNDRIRAIRYWDTQWDGPAAMGYFEFLHWRDQLTTFELVGASRQDTYSISSTSGDTPSMAGAAVTGSTFRMLGVIPTLGRTLDQADERIGAPDVVVIGQELWRSHFGSDPDVVGRTLRVGDAAHTVVGVMPQGFLFPGRATLWVPLRHAPTAEPGEGPFVSVFGRLADGVQESEASAEVTAAAQRLTAQFPRDDVRLRAEVVPFGIGAWLLQRGGAAAVPGFFSAQATALLLLLVACANVGMLIFARAATRLPELSIRTALGASRTRIVSQMLVESLVLAVSSAAVGLVGYGWLVERFERFVATSAQPQPLPYWFDLGLSGRAVLWALVLAALSAAAVGILPAVKVTGKGIQQRIQRAQAGRSGSRLGGMTGLLIVADVAVAVVAVGFAAGLSGRVLSAMDAREAVGIPAEEYLAVELTLPGGEVATAEGGSNEEAFRARLAATQRSLVERLEAEPGVHGVAVADRLPRMDHGVRLVEVEGLSVSEPDGPGGSGAPLVSTAWVDIGYFDGLERPVLSGRGFDEGDLGGQASTVIVNTTFVDRVLGGRNPIGRRIRFLSSGPYEASPWYEIIGVVGRLGMNVAVPERDQGVYFPVAPGRIHPVLLAIHVDGNPDAFAPRLRQVVADTDPEAAVARAIALDRVFNGSWYAFLAVTVVLAILVVILVAVAACGIYAIMSFAVSQRTREIGIRTALGARKGSILIRIARRSLAQIGLGALLGMPLAGWLYQIAESGGGTGGGTGLAASFGIAFATGVSVVAVVGLLSLLSPMRRALRIEPTEALRAEG